MAWLKMDITIVMFMIEINKYGGVLMTTKYTVQIGHRFRLIALEVKVGIRMFVTWFTLVNICKMKYRNNLFQFIN